MPEQGIRASSSAGAIICRLRANNAINCCQARAQRYPRNCQQTYSLGMDFSQPVPPAVPPSLQRALAYAHEHLGERMPLQTLAELAGLSLWRFAIVFRQHMGVPPHRYISQQRIRFAQQLLRNGMAAADVADACGFYDQSHFSRHFKSICGMTPGQYLMSGADPHTGDESYQDGNRLMPDSRTERPA